MRYTTASLSPDSLEMQLALYSIIRFVDVISLCHYIPLRFAIVSVTICDGGTS